MVRVTHAILLLALGSVAAASSPHQRTEPPTLSVRTDLVTLSITVVDREGALVSGLRQEHFTVYDNGEPQGILFFASEDVPATIGLLMDSSGSMRGRREHRTAVAAAFAAIGHPLDEFFCLQFNEDVWPVLPPSVGFTDDPERLRAALLVPPAQGMTALYDALDRGLHHLQQGTRGRKALIVVSDGGDNASRRTLAAVLDRARRTDAVIYGVTLSDPDNRDARPQVLKALAEATGGRVFMVKKPEDVTRSFVRIAEEIRGGYAIGFPPAGHSTGGFRSIRVVVSVGHDRQLIARTRAGYYAGPSGDAVR
jgi:Ca-activated chloride channel family protein